MCKEYKPLSEFWKHGRENYCKACKKLKRNPEVYKRAYLKHFYNLPLEKYNKMFEEQNGCCAICNGHQSTFKKALHVDHDHETGKIRGLLCNSCNKGIGFLLDDSKILLSASQYLKSYENGEK